MFSLQVFTPRRRLFDGQVVSLVAPGEVGYLGVLARHAPLVATLAPGKVTFREPSGGAQTLQSAAGGLLEVRANRAVLLLDEVSG